MLSIDNALSALPQLVRHMIYSFAFTPSAFAQITKSSTGQLVAERSFQILVYAHIGRPLCFDMRWLMDVQEHWTINDVRRKVHEKLWEINAETMPDERLIDDTDMWDLHIQLAISGEPRDRRLLYTFGARRFARCAQELKIESGLPFLEAYV